MHRVKSLGWSFGLTFAAIIAAFLGAMGVAQHATEAVRDDALDISDNAARSIISVAAARFDGHALYDELSTQLNRCSLGLPVSTKRSKELQQQISVRTREYFDLPAFPGEHGVQQAISAAFADVATSSQQAMDRLEHGECAAARTVIEGELKNAVSGTSSAFLSSIQFNAERARELGESIKATHEHARRLGYSLAVLAVILTVMGATMLARTIMQVTRLSIESARLHRERADELEVFAARVAHDIRSPLALTHMALDLLQRQKGDPRQLLPSAFSGVRRVERIIDGLYDFARSGARPRPNENAVVGDIVAEVVEEARLGIASEHQSIAVEPLPACRVAASAGVLTSLVSNLVNNALKHTGETGHVSIRVQAGSRVRVEVSDNGPGLAPGMEERVFRPYVRGDTTASGIGLGLATVKRLSEGHGGSCGVLSTPGKGCTFWFELPAAAEARLPAMSEALAQRSAH